jgi:tRNA dimethylallyltransferase
MTVPKPAVVFIIGPTASGKTQAALRLARLMPCDLISADSMQIYKGMDIITDKPSKIQRRAGRWHLLDVVSPAREFNVAAFCKEARKVLAQALKKKSLPVVVGGTGLYVDSLLHGIFESGQKDPEVRESLQREIEEKGLGWGYALLEEIDPLSAQKIDPNDARRIIRALEVYRSAGRPLSVLQKQRQGLTQDHRVFLFGLRREREELYRRIEERVDAMVKRGLLKEVAGLLKKKLSPTAYACIGIREIKGYLKGSHSLEEAISLLKRNSRHYAKRQMTWFRKNKDIEWIDVKGDEDLDQAARRIYSKVA